ncbi:unnamed protein product [Auanema sp. JU1783]|nr:unnamed protein product [Auanema sp. JU1783]
MTIGLESWFLNFTQLSRKAQSPETLADVPKPFFEYAIWGLFKGAEFASLIGGCVAHPIYRIYLTKTLKPENTTPNSSKIIRAKCRALQGRFLLAGLVLGPTLAYAHAINDGMSFSEAQKKCYLIRCDNDGMTLDRSAVVCGLVGWYWKRFQGAVDGINVGIAYATLSSKILSTYTNPVLQNAVLPEERYESVQEAAANRSRLTKFLSDLDKKSDNSDVSSEK